MLLPNLNYALCESTLGGLERVFVVPAEQVVSLPDPENFQIASEIILAPGAQLTELELPDMGGEYSETSAENDHGTFYKKKLELFLPKDSPEIAQWTNTLGKVRNCVLLYLDNNGFCKVVGSPEFPMVFASELNTARQAIAKAGHTFTWQGEALDKSFFYGELTVSQPPANGSNGEALPGRIVDGAGNLLALLQPGGTLVINSGFSFGFRILS